MGIEKLPKSFEDSGNNADKLMKLLTQFKDYDSQVFQSQITRFGAKIKALFSLVYT